MKRNYNEIDEDEQPVRTGILKSALLANDENRPLGRRDKWTKEAYKELEEAEKRGRRSQALFRKLDNEDYEQNEIEYPIIKRTNHYEATWGKPLKKRSFPTVAHNYSFWADLIFAPGSREKGMLLIVEEQVGSVGVTLSSIRVRFR